MNNLSPIESLLLGVIKLCEKSLEEVRAQARYARINEQVEADLARLAASENAPTRVTDEQVYVNQWAEIRREDN
jgi:hypothetical protein